MRGHWHTRFGRGSRSASRTPGREPGNGSPPAGRSEQAGRSPDCDGPTALRGEHARERDLAQRGNACCGSPGRSGTGRKFSRIKLLGAGLSAAAGTLGGGLVAQAGAAEPVQVWGLDPAWGGDPATCGCSACASCLAHAANKLFASASAADGGRAHLYCKCLVVSLGQIDQGTYDALFTEGGRRDSVDLRYQWVQAVLAQPAPVAAVFTDRPPHVRPLFAGMAAAADRGAHATRVLHVTLGRVRIRHGSSGRRWLHVDLDTLEPVSVTLSITRQGPTLVRQAEASVLGRHRFKVAIPNGAKAGPARLRLRVRDASGRVASITRVVQIPPA